MSEINWAERNAAWEGRAKLLGPRAVLHVHHKTDDQQEGIFRKQRVAIIPRFLQSLELVYPPARTILDFGCGVGRWTPILEHVSGCEVLGVDPTQTLLDAAIAERAKHAEAILTGSYRYALYREGHIPADNLSVDAIFCCMVLSTVLTEDMFRVTLEELNRVLRKGGLMFLVDNTEGKGGRPVRSPYSISRTIQEYQDAFAQRMGVRLEVLGDYEDLGETNTIFAGQKR